jgi:hypothetical protein
MGSDILKVLCRIISDRIRSGDHRQAVMEEASGEQSTFEFNSRMLTAPTIAADSSPASCHSSARPDTCPGLFSPQLTAPLAPISGKIPRLTHPGKPGSSYRSDPFYPSHRVS